MYVVAQPPGFPQIPGSYSQGYSAYGQHPAQSPQFEYGQPHHHQMVAPPQFGGNNQHIAYSMPTQVAAPPGSHTRNLIGSLAVPASKLTDQNHETGIWFVFQDLSVRTEGNFCLKFTFVDVNDPENHGHPTKRQSPILATVFSQTFQVYSAKKFPGVIESTELSKAFAQQGVKIPIRKDNAKIANAEEFKNDNSDPEMD
jgi:hypothetical protein